MNGDEQDAFDRLEQRLERLESRLSQVDSELTYKIDDARNDAERAVDSVRDDLKTLEHKVDYS
jgi:uncharacterized coiled-coil protein SlyX